MKFKHLNIPSHWQQYYTKYPEGYTILESLFSWVQQVNDMVDGQNKLSNRVEDIKGQVDDFIERFSGDLQNTVVSILYDWQESGFLNIVINEALQTHIDTIDSRLSELSKSVRDFGINSDGSDITTQLQDVLNTFTGTLFFPKGDYLLKESVFINHSNVKLMFSPESRVIFDGGDTTTSAFVFKGL